MEIQLGALIIMAWGEENKGIKHATRPEKRNSALTACTLQ